MALAAHSYEKKGSRPSTGERSTAWRARRRTRAAIKHRARIGLFVAVPLLLMFGYVGMTAELAAQTYRLSADRQQQAVLRQSADALGQRLAQVQALTQLERVAQQLHMTAPAAVVYVPVRVAAKAKPRSTTFAARFENITRWLHVR